ncbi:MAG: NTP transferase domain-containing protein [FCB group bacterium]|nr:NTP transferase domain-containing protein [FCB group bacterium]
MKGIILAGGLGSRMSPLTKITNKHLLPIYDQPMIYYPIKTLVEAGIKDITLVTGGNYAGDFLRLLSNGKEFGLTHINYVYQEGEGGIADALGLCRHYTGDENIVVMLGDNILQKSISPAVQAYRKQGRGAKILLKEVSDPERFGVAELDGDRVIGIEEKPKNPKTNLAVIGVYMYDSRVFDIISNLEPSGRGELEITDVNNTYIEWGEMSYEIVDGWWTDAGTFESLFRANRLAAYKRNPGLQDI